MASQTGGFFFNITQKPAWSPVFGEAGRKVVQLVVSDVSGSSSFINAFNNYLKKFATKTELPIKYKNYLILS